MNLNPSSYRLPILVLVFLSLNSNAGLGQNSKVKLNKTDAYLDVVSGPFTLKTTLNTVREIGQGNFYKPRFIKALQIRGVNFVASPENLNSLREAGADQELYALLTKLAQPYKPPPPPPATGIVDAACVPAECEIALGSSAPVATRNGQYVFKDVVAGNATLRVSKAGYVTTTVPILVEPGRVNSVPLPLEPTPQTKLALARESLDQLWKTLGYSNRGAGLQEFEANGTTSLFDVKGAESQWGISIKLSEKAASSIVLKTLSLKQAIIQECLAGSCQIKTPGGLRLIKKANVVLDLDEASILLNQFRRVHLGGIVSRLTAPEIRVLASELKPTGDRVFSLESNDETYEVEVGRDSLLARVSGKSKLRGDEYQVVYSGYAKLPNALQYPLRTEYRDRTGKRGIKVEFVAPVKGG